MKKLILGLAFMALTATGLSAQSEQARAQVTIPTLLRITVTGTDITFPAPTFGDYDSGTPLSTASTSVVDTRGNVEHQLTIAPLADFFDVDGAASTKPASHLRWRNAAGGTFAGMPAVGSPATVVPTIGRGNNTGAATIEYELELDETTDVPGDYTLDFLLTLTAN